MDRPDRRRFIASTVSAAVGASLAGCQRESPSAAVHTSPQVQWRLASSFPRGLDTIFGGAEIFAERLKALTDGRFTVRVYPAGEVVPALQVMDAVQQGTVQVGHTCSYYYTGKNAALAFDTCVPFGLTSRQQSAWLYEGGGLSLMRELFADFGIITFPAGNTGAQMGGWFNRELHSADDLKGLKMRIPGMGGHVMDRLGVTVQVLAGGDIFPALERGAIDATEWVGPYDDEKLGFYKIVKNYYYPGWWEPGPSLSLYVNLQAYNSLPASYKAAVEVASRDAAVIMQAQYDARNPAALARLIAAGVLVRRFPDDLMIKARAEAFSLMEEQASKETSYRKVFEPWNKFRKDILSWFATAEQAYLNFQLSE